MTKSLTQQNNSTKLIWSSRFEPGPWHMGRFSPYVNIWACAWTFFVSIIFILPTARPVAADTMNYASAFLTLILLAATVFWYISGKKYYHGPIIEAMGGSEDGDVSSDDVIRSEGGVGFEKERTNEEDVVR